MAAKMPEQQTDADKIYRVTITTDRGSIVMDLDPQLAPNTVNNFIGLARQGYYDALTFHRVVPEFVIQGGCPEGSGRGGPGYKFADEPVKGQYTLGAVAMANAGPDTNGSQFFICIDDCTTQAHAELQPVRPRRRRHRSRAGDEGRRRVQQVRGRRARPVAAAGCRVVVASCPRVGRQFAAASIKPYRLRIARTIVPKNSASIATPTTKITIIAS